MRAHYLVLPFVATLLAGCNTLDSLTRFQSGFSSPTPPESAAIQGSTQNSASGQPKPISLAYSQIGNESPYEVLGRRYNVLPTQVGYQERGTASWFGLKFEGKATANGEIYDSKKFSAAHKTLPLPSFAKVTNVANGRSVIVRVNDRGPFYGNRLIDVSYAAAEALGMLDVGTAEVIVEGIDATRYETGTPAANPDPQQRNQYPTNTEVVGYQNSAPGGTATPAMTAPQISAVAQPTTSPQAPATLVAGRYLQIGAFSKPELAMKAKLKLDAVSGYPVVLQEIRSAGKVLTRVVIGPLPADAPITQISRQVQGAGFAEPFVKMLP